MENRLTAKIIRVDSAFFDVLGEINADTSILTEVEKRCPFWCPLPTPQTPNRSCTGSWNWRRRSESTESRLPQATRNQSSMASLTVWL